MSTTSNASKRIVFTGGSGVAGRHVIEKLLSYGHEILNVDVVPLDNPSVYTLKADLTDGAQAFNSLSCHFKVSEPFMDPVKTPDAVVHFAGKSFCLFSHSFVASRISTQTQHI
jgi:nucleoside-diphosphate-sugar epimerase